MTMWDRSPTGTLPARVTTPLLTLITQQSLDEDYEHVAQQRRSGLRAISEHTGRSARTLAIVLVFGALLAIAAVQTAERASVTSAGREQLISRIETRRAGLADLQHRIGRLHAENGAAEDAFAAVGQRLDALTSTRVALEVRTGFGALSGPGVRVSVDDAPTGGAAGRVRDDDLALLVNGLWEAGASGISINGQRLTVLSSLRNTAQTIRINDTSLSPPYVVLAVGDERRLQADLAESTSGAQFAALTQQYGMPVTMQDRDEVRLPPAPTGMMSVHTAKAAESKPAKRPANQEDTP